MRRGIDAHVGYLAPIELSEQRPEPVGMLVVDGDWSVGCCRHCFSVVSLKKAKGRVRGETRPLLFQPSTQTYQVKRLRHLAGDELAQTPGSV
jgi:hypothetical protein